MKAAAFDYVSATSLDEAAQILSAHDGDAKVIAGGQSLVPMMALRFVQPGVLVDINRIPGLNYVTYRDGCIAVGALARHSDLEKSADARRRQPLLGEAIKFVAHRQIRNRGTVCGSLAHADPAAELPTVAVALNAEFVVHGPHGSRTIAASDFFRSYLTTVLKPDEILSEVRFPVAPARTGCAFLEISRRHGDFALVGVAATVTLAADGTCLDARIAIAGVSDTPVCANDVAATLRGKRITPVIAAEAGHAAARDLSPPGDIHARSEYRKQVAPVLVRRALLRAADTVVA